MGDPLVARLRNESGSVLEDVERAPLGLGFRSAFGPALWENHPVAKWAE